MAHLSTGQWIFYGVLSVVWAVLGYRLSEKDRKVLGRTPWGLPSGIWAFFWFLSLVLGLVLYLIAHSGGVRQAQRNGPYPGAPRPMPPAPMSGSQNGRAPSASDLFPAYPRPANSQPEAEAVTPQDAEEPASSPTPSATEPPAAQASWPDSPPAWHPDPSGRFHYRWWDGSEWTSQVSTDGHHLIDTNPDQRIGPY